MRASRSAFLALGVLCLATCWLLAGSGALSSSALAPLSAGHGVQEHDGVASTPVDFDRDVLPILTEACFACHGPDAATREGDLRLDREEDAKRALEGGEFIISPGHPEKSLFYERIAAEDPDDLMPPPDFKVQLTPEQVATLKRWIEEGAPWAAHWAYRPVVRPGLPEGFDRSDSAIDAFLATARKARGLKTTKRAPATRLFRRASLTLTGLPPSPEEVATFEADPSEAAWSAALDRLLASPHFGERMAVPWLDAARYADTNGHYFDNERVMWPWRDWVVEAFNRNLPYDQFIVEQLAGDLIPNATESQHIASGFNRNHAVSWENGIIPEEYRVKYVFDRTDTTASVFLGLTMQCAQCHDHKYDAITHKDYFRFFAFFNQVTDLGADGIYGNAEPTFAAPTAEQRDQLRIVLNERLAFEQELTRPRPKVERAEEAFLSDLAKEVQEAWTPMVVERAASSGGSTLKVGEAGDVKVGGSLPVNEVFELEMSTADTAVRRLRLDALHDADLPQGGPGRASDGNFILNDLEIEVSRDSGKNWQEPALTRAAADTNVAGFHASLAIDADPKTGWSVGRDNAGRTRSLMIELAETWVAREGEPLRFRVRMHHDVGYPDHSLGRMRWFTSDRRLLDEKEAVTSFEDWEVGGPIADSEQRSAPALVEELEFQKAPFLFAARPQSVSKNPGRHILRRRFTLKEAASFTLYTRSTRRLRVWLNTKLKHGSPGVADFRPSSIGLILKPGTHEFLVEVESAPGEGPDFYFDLRRSALEVVPFEIEVLSTRADHLAHRESNVGLRRYYRRRYHPELRRAIDEYDRVDRIAHQLVEQVPKPMVMQDRKEPRKTFLLERGRYDQPGEEVFPGVPESLPPLNPRGQGPADRLDLARWLVRADHPLTARVAVNRIWELIFGRGLVATSHDFGVRGDRPSHPELLDWLSVEFRESGWDLKALIKTIMMSEAFRLDSAAAPELRAADPENRWLTRGPRQRLAAEFIRDQALHSAGKLNRRRGGRGFFPYQPPGIWEELSGTGGTTAQFYRQSRGDELYRRSLYVFWKRSASWPVFDLFDAPNREVCAVQRQRTNTPQQALVLMNEPTFLEAARLFAQRLLREVKEGDSAFERRLDRGYRLLLARSPDRIEEELLRGLFVTEKTRFAGDLEAARALLSVGQAPVPQDADLAELAAWTQLASLLFNLDEAVTVE